MKATIVAAALAVAIPVAANPGIAQILPSASATTAVHWADVEYVRDSMVSMWRYRLSKKERRWVCRTWRKDPHPSTFRGMVKIGDNTPGVSRREARMGVRLAFNQVCF